jgi:hypothetical protein
MIDRDKFAEAARYSDAQSEEHGLQSYLDRKQIDLSGLLHITEQRAMRVAMLAIDGVSAEEMVRINSTNEPTVIRLSPQAQEMMPAIQAAILDGIVIGITVKED